MIIRNPGLKNTLLSLLFVFVQCSAFSQKDSLSPSLSFDFGITRGRNINLWPFFRKFKNEERKELQILFPLFSKSTDFKTPSNHLHILPITILDSNSNGSDKRFISLFYPSVLRFQKKYSAGDKITSFKFLELAPNISLLSLSRSPGGLLVENNAFFFIWHKKDLQSKKTRFVVFPAYWYFSNKYDTTQILPPLFYKKTGLNYKKLNVALLYNYKKSEKEKSRVLFPVFWQKEWYNKGDTAKRITIFPFYWSLKNKDENNQVFFPFAYSLKNRAYHSLTVLPFFSSGHSPDHSTSHLALFPFYWSQKTPVSDYRVFFPFWWNTKNFYTSDTLSTNIFFPFYWSQKSREVNNQFLIPLMFRFKNNDYSSLTVLPFFSRGTSPDRKRQHLVFFPYWHLKAENSLSNGMFPLWWSNQEFFQNDTLVRQSIFPLYWKFSSKEKDNEFFFPFVYKIRNRQHQSFTYFPFVSTGRNLKTGNKYSAISPFYWRFEKANERNEILIPLYWSSIRYNNRDTINKKLLFPFYWSVKSRERKHKIFFPLIYSFKDSAYRSFTVFPLFSLGRSADLTQKHFNVFPFLWKLQTTQSLSKVVFPFWWSYQRFLQNDTVSYKAFFPLYWSLKSKEKSNTVIFPFVYKIRNPDHRSFTFFPLFSSGQNLNSGNKYIAVSPMFWHLKKTNETRNILFPLYWNSMTFLKNDTVSKNVVFPFYWSLKGKERNYKVLFPLVFSIKDSLYQSFSIFPFLSLGHAPDFSRKHFYLFPFYRNIKARESSSKIIFPLWWNRTEYFQNDTLTRKAFFPLYWSVKSRHSAMKIIFPLVYKIKNSQRESLTIFPFFSSGKEINTRNKYSAISPFYWHFEKEHEVKNIFLPLFFRSSVYLNNDTVKKNILFPLFWSVKSKFKNNKIFFPFIFSLKNPQKESFTFFPVFSFGLSFEKERKYIMITPLAGSFSMADKKRTFLFPLFNYVKTDKEVRSSVLLFIFRKTKKQDYSKTSLLWPLCEHLKTINSKRFRIAPFVWYAKSDSARMFSLQPFLYSYKSASRRTFILSWFLFKYENLNEHSVSKSILWKVFHSEKFSNGDFETRILHLVYANINRKGMREKSILPFYHFQKHRNGEQTKSIFFSFYNYFKQAIPGADEFYEEERIFWFIRLRSNYAKLKSEGKEKYLKRKSN